MACISRVLLALALSTSSLVAMDDVWRISTDYNHFNRADYTKQNHRYKHKKLSFQEGRALALYDYQLDGDSTIELGAGYMMTEFGWTRHPRFHRHHFDNILFSIGADRRNVGKWMLDADLNVQVNSQHFTAQYTFFRSIVHGRYAWKENSGLHVGMLAMTGMRYTRAFPILGFDYFPHNDWKINMVFPVNVSVAYKMTSHFSVEAALRTVLSRQRFPKDTHPDKGLVAYRNWGAELGLDYAWSEFLSLNAHIGESIKGHMRVADKNDRHRTHYRIRSALYWGAFLSIAF